jgi:hypothetical protein
VRASRGPYLPLTSEGGEDLMAMRCPSHLPSLPRPDALCILDLPFFHMHMPMEQCCVPAVRGGAPQFTHNISCMLMELITRVNV